MLFNITKIQYFLGKIFILKILILSHSNILIIGMTHGMSLLGKFKKSISFYIIIHQHLTLIMTDVMDFSTKWLTR